ncbi:MAG: patatin-like phospholipase family protein [Myxococcales bacterium]|nr:patatin-like phospholipase family protein [Myxococcales bacterium]MCB9554194.1 patatin-like phospholipase family protein [Myxococcales bacterium]
MPTTALVLSGGGARGAYEAGVIAGVIDVLGLRERDPAPFRIFTGASVGAINAAFLAAHADRGDLNITDLIGIWRRLSLQAHLQLDPLGLLGVRQRLRALVRAITPHDTLGRSLLDAAALERTVIDGVPWDRLHRLIDAGTLHALVIATLRIADGRTTLFAELAPDARFAKSLDPRRQATETRIGPEHVLASAAIPLIFPARRIADAWHCDGGLRFNTPIAPAIRCGADKLMVVSLLHKPTHATTPPPIAKATYPDPIFLLGKVFNALLLDPIDYDLQVLERFNALLEVIDDRVPPTERAHIDQILIDTRGAPYRKLDLLSFRPTVDLGQLAGHHLQNHKSIDELGRGVTWLLRRAARHDATWEVDLASYLLFDGEYATRLIEQGMADVHQRADDVRAFFDA